MSIPRHAMGKYLLVTDQYTRLFSFEQVRAKSLIRYIINVIHVT
jgi:hypothetical protein